MAGLRLSYDKERVVTTTKDTIISVQMMLISFYVLVWCGASGWIIRDILPTCETFGERTFSVLFGIVMGAIWPMLGGALMMKAAVA